MSSYIFHISFFDLVLLGAAFIAIGFCRSLWYPGKGGTSDWRRVIIKRFFIQFGMLCVCWVAYIIVASLL